METLIKVNGAAVCKIALALWISLVVAAWPQAGEANGGGGPTFPCRDRASMEAFLYTRYHEVPAGGGPEKSGAYVELFRALPTSPEDTYSVVVHGPTGVSCLVIAGEGWRDVEMVAPADGI